MMTPTNNASMIRSTENRLQKVIEKTIKEEHERRNKAKMMLQAVLIHRVSKHPAVNLSEIKENTK